MLRGKRLIAILLVLVMAATTFAACGKKAEEVATPTAAPEAPKAEATTAPTAAPAAEETAPADPNALPRTETLYFGGQQWNTVNGWNPLGDNNNNALALASSGSGSRTVMFETLYMYNFLDGSMTPLLADGDYQWNDAKTEMTVKINPAAKWSDGKIGRASCRERVL